MGINIYRMDRVGCIEVIFEKDLSLFCLGEGIFFRSNSKCKDFEVGIRLGCLGNRMKLVRWG